MALWPTTTEKNGRGLGLVCTLVLRLLPPPKQQDVPPIDMTVHGTAADTADVHQNIVACILLHACMRNKVCKPTV